MPQFFGKWIIHRAPYDAPAFGWKDCTFLARKITVPVDMHNIHLANGTETLEEWDTVMEDSAGELKKHLPIWLKAKGRVLITGLGLGCVVRGLLASLAVEHIDVWTPKNEGLQVQHAKLMVKYRRVIETAQGAWQFPRCFKRGFSAHMPLL